MRQQARKTFGQLPTQLPHARTQVAQPQAFQPHSPQPHSQSNPVNPPQIDPELYADILGTGFGEPKTASGSRQGQPVKLLRFVSGVIDLMIMGLITWLILHSGQQAQAGMSNPELYALVWQKMLWVFLAPLIYGVAMEASPLQGTIGKLVTGTVITDMQGRRISFLRALGRNLGKILSGLLPFGIAYGMVLFSDKAQALHDKMAGTLVFKRGEGPGDS